MASVFELGDSSIPFSRGQPMSRTWVSFASPITYVSLKCILNYQVNYFGDTLVYETTGICCIFLMHVSFSLIERPLFIAILLPLLILNTKCHAVSRVCSSISNSGLFSF